jgi:hypothetical protein
VAISALVFKNQRYYVSVMYIRLAMHDPVICSAMFLISLHLQV